MRRLILSVVLAGMSLPAVAVAQISNIPETEASCDVAGGRWARGGLSGQSLCFLPTSDAGKACTKAEDCTEFCLAETRTCSPEAPMFGCIALLELDGTEVTLCID